jgi:hypothetical protein
MTKNYIFILLITLAACSSRGCVESEFHLAKDSKLPVWFQIPDGMNRQDLDVILTYYTTGPADITLIDIRDGKSKPIIKIKGENIHHPEYWAWAQEDWPNRSHPGFVVINVNGVSEIIEHKKMEPLFYVSNEATVQRTIAGKNSSKHTSPEKIK